MHKSRALVAATLLTLLTAASAFADARKPFAGICEGVVQLGFFIDGTVSMPTEYPPVKTQRKKSIGRYKCTFTDPEISTVVLMA